MRQPFQLTFDPDCDCDGGLLGTEAGDSSGVVITQLMRSRLRPVFCHCVKADATQPRQPCPNCGGLAVRDGRCVGCDLARSE